MTEQNAAEAEALFEKADKCEEDGLQAEAFEYMLKAAELGNSSAQASLGNYFSEGKGIKKSDKKAAYWYRRASRQGNDTGAFNLAVDKLKAKNLRAAIVWFERARNMGSGEAALELAKIYLGKRRGKAKAIHLWETTQQMKPYEISDDAKEEAALLLSKTIAIQ